jgi:zinc protease
MTARFLVALCFLVTGWAAPAFALTVTRVVSDRGISAWLAEDHHSPIISMSFDFRGGASLDPADKAGLAEMVADLLGEGAGELDAKSFQSRLNKNHIALNFWATPDSFHGGLQMASGKRGLAQDLLGQALTRPRFDAASVASVRDRILADLDRTIDEPDSIAQRTLAETLFPGHPYGAPTDGLPDTIRAISRNDLVAWAKHHLGRDALTVAVAGDISPPELRALLDQTFGGLPEHADPVTLADVTPNEQGTVQVVRRPIPESVALFGAPALKRDDPDWYPAILMTDIMGGEASSRLVTEIRDQRGLADRVYCRVDPFAHSGLLRGGLSARNDKIGDAIALVRQEWTKMADGGVSADELAAAKSAVNATFPSQLASQGATATLLNQIQNENLGMDFVRRRSALVDSVSVDDVNRVAKRLLKVDALSFVVVGDPVGM